MRRLVCHWITNEPLRVFPRGRQPCCSVRQAILLLMALAGNRAAWTDPHGAVVDLALAAALSPLLNTTHYYQERYRDASHTRTDEFARHLIHPIFTISFWPMQG